PELFLKAAADLLLIRHVAAGWGASFYATALRLHMDGICREKARQMSPLRGFTTRRRRWTTKMSRLRRCQKLRCARQVGGLRTSLYTTKLPCRVMDNLTQHLFIRLV